MKLYLLFYDTDVGSREEWNTFYTPVEVFDSAAKRQARIDFIRQQSTDYDFHEIDTELMTDEMSQGWDRDDDDEYDEDEEDDRNDVIMVPAVDFTSIFGGKP